MSPFYSAVLPSSLMVFYHGDNSKSTFRPWDVFRSFSHVRFNRGEVFLLNFWMLFSLSHFVIENIKTRTTRLRSLVFCAFEICPSFCAMHFISNRFFHFGKIGSIQNPPVPSNSKSNQQCGNFTIISAIPKGFCLDASGKSPQS